MAPQAASVTNLLSSLANQEHAPLRIHFPETTIQKPGSSVTKPASKPSPTLSISSTITANKPATQKYAAIAIDLDAPFRSFAFLSPILHGIQLNLVAAGSADPEGFVKLEAEENQAPVVPWGPPNPPPISSAHRYVFLVWEQPDGMTVEKVKGTLNLKEPVSLGARIRWDEAGFEKKLGLGEVLAGNFFTCG
ncbi:PEBP-like protein [Rhizodiscina lignyota]|uniref:PEBP-like protein n=1 Tax=Rhizodiscina lignyota TaxID=1504668 RepID=A0A9P4IIY4_9PEZI|nr:PEBP-like protein [Rhizodiscina lignyota]